MEKIQPKTQLIMLICLYAILRTKANQIYILSNEYKFSPTYIQDLRADINTGNLSVNVTFNVAKDFPLDPWMATSIDVRNRKTNRYRTLLHLNPTNLCNVMRDVTSNLLKTWARSFLKHGSSLPKCPYDKVGNYSWHNVGAADMNVPNFVSGKYRINVMMYFKKGSHREMVTNGTLYWEVK